MPLLLVNPIDAALWEPWWVACITERAVIKCKAHVYAHTLEFFSLSVPVLHSPESTTRCRQKEKKFKKNTDSNEPSVQLARSRSRSRPNHNEDDISNQCKDVRNGIITDADGD